MTRYGPHAKRGLLTDLRRFSGVGVVLFALMLVVGSYRAHALALVVGDDDLCSAMAYAARPASAEPADPTDLADDHHACCDLGLCLDASALPPSVPPSVALPRRVRRVTMLLPAREARRPARRRSHRPRGPPRS